MDQTDQKRARSKFFSVDIWRVFGPPSGKKKEIWFMLKHGQNSRFNFHIIEKLSAPWWLRWKEKNLFDPMGFLWDVYWPHWPSLVQIRGPPWVRHESLAPRISVKVKASSALSSCIPKFMTVHNFGCFSKFLSCYEFWYTRTWCILSWKFRLEPSSK